MCCVYGCMGVRVYERCSAMTMMIIMIMITGGHRLEALKLCDERGPELD